MKKQVEFDITVDAKDMYDFLIRHFYGSFSGKFGLVLSIGALLFFFLGLGKRDLFQLTILLILGLLFTLVQPLQMKLKASAQIKANPMFSEPIHFLFDEKGMNVSQNGQKALLPWKDIRRVKESAHSIFVYVSSINANIIPKGKLEKEQLSDLKDMLREHLDKSVCHLR